MFEEIKEILRQSAIHRVEIDRNLQLLSEDLRRASKLSEENTHGLKELKEEIQKLTKSLQSHEFQQEKEIAELRKSTKQLNKQMGELGNKLGTFTEGLAFKSLEKIMRKRFKSTFIGPNVWVTKDKKHLEIDVLGYANGEVNVAVAAEVKSHLREEHVNGMLEKLAVFPHFFPEHSHKRLYGMLVGAVVPETVRNYAAKKGLYVGRMSKDAFRLVNEEGFEGKDFQAA
jgi:seryl-tRNA synthetase